MTARNVTGRHAERWRFSALAYAFIAVGSLVYGVTAYAVYLSVSEMVNHFDLRREGYEAALVLERTSAAAVDLDANLHRYLLHGDDAALQAFLGAREALRTQQRQVAAFSSRSLDTSASIEARAAGRMIADRLDIADIGVAARREGTWANDAGAAERHQHGHQLMVQLRGELGTLLSQQAAVIDRGNRDGAEIARVSVRIVGGLAAGGAVLMGTAMWLLWREDRLRNESADAARMARDHLEHEVIQRTEALSEAMRRIQSFAGELDLHVEEERRRLSRDVHDQLGQITTAAKIAFGELARSHPELPTEPVAQLRGLLDDAIHTTRRIAAELRPPLLDDIGFGAAVQHHLRSVGGLGKLAVDVRIADDDRLGPAQANQLFRILQEATTNVLRHAAASSLTVRGGVDGDAYGVDIIDDGRGPQDMRSTGSGVRNMRERAALVGGSLHFGPGPAGGTRVTVRVPLEETAP